MLPKLLRHQPVLVTILVAVLPIAWMASLVIWRSHGGFCFKPLSLSEMDTAVEDRFREDNLRWTSAADPTLDQKLSLCRFLETRRVGTMSGNNSGPLGWVFYCEYKPTKGIDGGTPISVGSEYYISECGQVAFNGAKISLND